MRAGPGPASVNREGRRRARDTRRTGAGGGRSLGDGLLPAPVGRGVRQGHDIFDLGHSSALDDLGGLEAAEVIVVHLEAGFALARRAHTGEELVDCRLHPDDDQEVTLGAWRASIARVVAQQQRVPVVLVTAETKVLDETRDPERAFEVLIGVLIPQVVGRIQAAAIELGLEGEVCLFGSHVGGFGRPLSDIDVSFMTVEGPQKEFPVEILQKFANELPQHGFREIVKIFAAGVPLVKAIDLSGIQVDLCIDNHLGGRNSELIAAYCALDHRVAKVGRVVKQWAKGWEMVGSSDGHLNSYAYTLLVLHYLMHTHPPVLPNLQSLAVAGAYEPDCVRDPRANIWDCRFWRHIELIPSSENRENVDTLLRGFFNYYSQFDWVKNAVSIRLANEKSRGPTPKDEEALLGPISKEQWYIEDPFDLRHNLAAQCTKEGRQRILGKMEEAWQVLSGAGPQEHAGKVLIDQLMGRTPQIYALKCRVSAEKVTSTELVECLRAAQTYESFTVRFPRNSRGDVADAFAIFHSEEDRRRVHRLNETYVGQWQLRLLPCSSWALEDAARLCEYECFDVAPPPETDRSAAMTSESLAALREQEAFEVRKGLRVATKVEEIEVLRQRAQALGLQHEVELGNHAIKQHSQRLADSGPQETAKFQ